MNSRERVQAVLNHKLPDRMPIDFGAHRSSGMGAEGYNKLKKHLGYSPETTKLYDLMQQLAFPEPFMVERFGGDILQIMQLKPAFGVRTDRWKCGYLPCGDLSLLPYDFNPVRNEKGDYEIHNAQGICIGRRPEKGIYYDNTNYFLEGVDSIQELKEKMILPEITEEELDFIEVHAKELYYNTDKALLYHVGCAVFEEGQQEFGFEDFYYNLAAEKEMIHYWAEKMTDAYCVMLDKILDRIGPYLDIAMFGGDDLGTQQSTQLSVEMYQEMIKPYHKKIYQFVQKKAPNVKVGLHCCGAIKELIPELIDAGVQVLNPVQISAKGMDPRELKEKFGKDIVFWGGGADMQGFVNHTEDPGEIYHHVRNMLEIFAPGGNYIFAPVHNILDNVSPEKVIAIYQAALDYRRDHVEVE
jgi:uroporphyrinogen decarboxylase